MSEPKHPVKIKYSFHDRRRAQVIVDGVNFAGDIRSIDCHIGTEGLPVITLDIIADELEIEIDDAEVITWPQS